MITPLSTRPTPPPTPNTELTVPIPTPIFSARELVADDPEGEREDGRAGALETRKTISDARLQAAAAASDASPKIPSEITSMRFLP